MVLFINCPKKTKKDMKKQIIIKRVKDNKRQKMI